MYKRMYIEKKEKKEKRNETKRKKETKKKETKLNEKNETKTQYNTIQINQINQISNQNYLISFTKFSDPFVAHQSFSSQLISQMNEKMRW